MLLRNIGVWPKPKMPYSGSSLALWGTGGFSSGLIGWTLRNLFTGAGPQCQQLIQEAAEAVQSRCAQSCFVTNSASSDLTFTYLDLTPEQIRIFLIGFLAGLCFFLVIDVLYVLKGIWLTKVQNLVRSFTHKPPQPHWPPNTYSLPQHAA